MRTFTELDAGALKLARINPQDEQRKAGAFIVEISTMLTMNTNKSLGMQAAQTRLIRAPEVLAMCAFGRSSLYQNIERGLFTRPVAIGRRARAWPLLEVEQINQARIAGLSNERIISLVEYLHAQRARAVDAFVAGASASTTAEQ
jgi:prophage regulatory protein